VIRMRLPIIMEDFLPVLSRDLQAVSEIVIARGQHDFSRTIIVDGVVPVGRGHAKIAVLASDGFYPLVLADMQLEVFGDATVIFQRFEPVWLSQRCGERNVANL